MKSITLCLFVTLAQNLFAQSSSIYSTLKFSSKALNRVRMGEMYTYRPVAVDSVDNVLFYSVQQLPAWLNYDSIKHMLSGKTSRPGQYPVHVTVRNTDTIVNQHFMLTVYNDRTTNILCLGNSITNGTDKYNSYRRRLWHLLHQGKYNIDLIGSWDGHHMGGQDPNPDFDMDHDGHSGWTAGDLLNPPDWDKQRGNIHDWLQQYKPDMVLMELGTNEVFQCVPVKTAMQNIGMVIDSLRKNNSKVKIFLALIPPLGKKWADQKLCGNDTGYAQRVSEFNAAVRTFAVKKSTTISNIILVDQYTGIDPATDMYDDIHPNTKGEQIMAQRWFTAIRPYLNKL